MTREKWAAMSDNERRIKIANLLGIFEVKEVDAGTCDICDIGSWDGKKNGMPVDVPDYCNDLNAMNEAENLIGNMSVYQGRLAFIVAGGKHGGASLEQMIRATAAQRAEAFALTMEPES